MSSFGEVVPSFFLASCKDMTDFGDIIESGDYSLANYCDIIRPVKVRFWFFCFIGFDGSAALFPSFVCIRCLFSLSCL